MTGITYRVMSDDNPMFGACINIECHSAEEVATVVTAALIDRPLGHIYIHPLTTEDDT